MNTAVMMRHEAGRFDRDHLPKLSAGGLKIAHHLQDGIRIFGQAVIDVAVSSVMPRYLREGSGHTNVTSNWRSSADASKVSASNKYDLLSLGALKVLDVDYNGEALMRSLSDAFQFLSSYSSDMPQPKIHTSEDGEVLFVWKVGQKRAKVSFDGDGSYGYALLVDGRYHGGRYEGICGEEIPADLVEYLKG